MGAKTKVKLFGTQTFNLLSMNKADKFKCCVSREYARCVNTLNSPMQRQHKQQQRKTTRNEPKQKKRAAKANEAKSENATALACKV